MKQQQQQQAHDSSSRQPLSQSIVLSRLGGGSESVCVRFAVHLEMCLCATAVYVPFIVFTFAVSS